MSRFAARFIGLVFTASLLSCGSTVLVDTVIDLRAVEGLVDFGESRLRVDVTREVHLVNFGKMDLELNITTTGPFSATQGAVVVASGQTATLTVTFTPRRLGSETGVLSATSAAG